MIFKLIEERLKRKAFNEKHELMKLQWQKAELEKKIAESKRKK